MFATGLVLVGLCLLAQAFVGDEGWRRRPWRASLWPSLAFTMGVLMWPVMVFFTNSTIHMLAHSSWAQVMMLSGAAELGLVRGKLHSRYWRLTMPFAFLVSGAAFLIPEQISWCFARAPFLHHLIGWTLIIGAIFPLLAVFRPRSEAVRAGFALTFVVLGVMLYCDRDTAPVFGHLSPLAGAQHK
jgi:hypothetical protein